MRFAIAPQVFALLPELRVGVLVLRGLNNAGERPELSAMLREEAARVRREFTPEALTADPRIECWRAAYRAFGAKPKEHRSSVENLFRSVVRGTDPRAINPLVDLYNLVSLRRMLPLGGEDLDAVSGDVELAVAGPAEPPVKLLGDAEARPPHAGEIVYRDAVSAICRRLNWREAERTKLTGATKNALLVVEALPPSGQAELDAALAELSELSGHFCGAAGSAAVLAPDRPALEMGG